MDKKENLKGVIWNSIGMGLSSITSLILLIIVTRINGINYSGSFSFIFSLTLIIYTLTLFGGRVYQVSDYKNDFSYNDYYSLKVITSFLSIIIISIYLLIGDNSKNDIIIAFILMIAKILDAFSDTIYGTFQKNYRLDLIGKSLTIKTLLSLIMFLIVDLLTKNIVVSTFSYLLCVIIIFIFFDKKYEKKYEETKIHISNQTFKLMFDLKFIFINNFVTNVLVNVPRFVVKNVYTEKELGYFGILIMIPTILSIFGQFIVQPSMLFLTECFKNKQQDKFNRHVNRLMFYILVISLICCVFAYAIGPELLGKLYSNNFEKYRMSLIFLIIGGMFNVFCLVLSTALNILRKTKYQTVIFTIILCLSALLSYIFAINYSDEVIFIIYALTMIIQFIMIYIYYVIEKNKMFRK